MTVMWIPGHLLAAPTPAVMAGAIDDPGSPVRSLLDSLYDSTEFASQAEALSGAHAGKSMSPLRSKQAFDSWFPDAYAGQLGQHNREIALFRFTGEALTVPQGSNYVFTTFGTVGEVDPAGIVSLDGGWITVAQDGLYQLSANIALGRTTPAPASASDTVQVWWSIPGYGTSIDAGYGFAEETRDGVVTVTSTPPPLALRAGQQVALLVRPVTVGRPLNSESRPRNRVSVERLGPMIGWPTA